MKKQDLLNYGVQEMNVMEMKETDGGFLFLLWFGTDWSTPEAAAWNDACTHFD